MCWWTIICWALHLKKNVSDHGPLESSSLFVFEDWNGDIGNFHGTQNIANQVKLQRSRWLPFLYWMSLNKWLNNNWWRRFGKRLLFNDIQSKRDNQRDGFWLARMNLATHSSRSNTLGFWFSSRASSGPFGWIFDWKVREESWIFWPLCCKVWKRSDAILGGKIAPALEPFQNKDSSLVLLLYGTVNGELKFIQNRSKNHFWGKRTTIDHRQGNSTFIYHWFIYIVSDISL